MIRFLIPLFALAALAPAAEGHRQAKDRLGSVVGRQVVDAGHVLEVRALSDGQYLIRWGDLDNAIAGKAGKGSAFTWDGGAGGVPLAFVKVVRFEDGAGKGPGKSGQAHGDRVTGDGYGGRVTWKARTTSAWDGVVVKPSGSGTMTVNAGSASVSVAIP